MSALVCNVYNRLIDSENVSQKSEDNLAVAEAELDKQAGIVSDLTRRVEELQVHADEAARLKDQMDEYVKVYHFLYCLIHFLQVSACR